MAASEPLDHSQIEIELAQMVSLVPAVMNVEDIEFLQELGTIFDPGIMVYINRAFNDVFRRAFEKPRFRGFSQGESNAVPDVYYLTVISNDAAGLPVSIGIISPIVSIELVKSQTYGFDGGVLVTAFNQLL